MNQCFENLIGISDTCNDVSPSSGLTFKSIGVTVSEADDLINADYESGEDLITEKLGLATKVVSDRVVNHLADKFRSNSLIDSQRLGFPKDNLVLVAGESGYLKGIKLELKNTTSFLDVYVSEINIQVDYTGTFNILVYDLIQNKLIDTLPITTVSGEISRLFVNKLYKSNRKLLNLVFVYDTTGKDSYSTEIKRHFCATCSGSYHVGINTYLNAGGVKVLSSDTKTLEKTTAIAYTAGMSIQYSIQCNNEDWLCTYSNLMALSIAFKTAYLIMEYGIHNSNRTNNKTIDIEKLQQRMEFYDFEYNKSQGNLLKNIKLPTDNVCFQCNSRSRHTFAM